MDVMLQKERKKQTEASGTENQPPTESPRPNNHSTSAGSTPASTLLNDKEVEEIIRFINGVDNAMTSTSSVSSSTTKQKTKQKCRKVGITPVLPTFVSSSSSSSSSSSVFSCSLPPLQVSARIISLSHQLESLSCYASILTDLLDSHIMSLPHNQLHSIHAVARSIASFTTNANLLSIPRFRTTFASCGFSVAALAVWNSL